MQRAQNQAMRSSNPSWAGNRVSFELSFLVINRQLNDAIKVQRLRLSHSHRVVESFAFWYRCLISSPRTVCHCFLDRLFLNYVSSIEAELPSPALTVFRNKIRVTSQSWWFAADRRTSGRSDRAAYRQTDRQMDGRTDRQRHMVERTEERADKRRSPKAKCNW